eukprot:1152181-Pelagomonas_calceolata.AAC.2
MLPGQRHTTCAPVFSSTPASFLYATAKHTLLASLVARPVWTDLQSREMDPAMRVCLNLPSWNADGLRQWPLSMLRVRGQKPRGQGFKNGHVKM